MSARMMPKDMVSGYEIACGGWEIRPKLPVIRTTHRNIGSMLLGFIEDLVYEDGAL